MRDHEYYYTHDPLVDKVLKLMSLNLDEKWATSEKISKQFEAKNESDGWFDFSGFFQGLKEALRELKEMKDFSCVNSSNVLCWVFQNSLFNFDFKVIIFMVYDL